MGFLNLSFYLFTPLERPEEWADRLKEQLGVLDIKGTLILATEGINGFLAGPEVSVRQAMSILASHPPFASIRAKESFSGSLPFEKLCFKVKPEIVTFRVPGVDATKAPHLPPEELRRWYDSGEDFVILDTRNEYEVKVGAFAGAKSLGLKHFVEFPEAEKNFPADWKSKKIVTYCTGGIRCEKAAPYLRQMGYEAYQLEGGILNYFEKVGGNHWNGECFVFDQRVGVNPDLSPSGAHLCSACQGPVPKGSAACPHCGGAS